MTDVDREYKRIEPRLRRIERDVNDAGLTADERAALMIMVAARLMGTAGAMMAAVADVKAGRPMSDDVGAWVEAVAKEIVAMMKSGGRVLQ